MPVKIKAPKPLSAARQRYLANRGVVATHTSPPIARTIVTDQKDGPSDSAAVGQRVQSGPVGFNPHSWLALTGDRANVPGRRVMAGVLRPSFGDRQNSATEFCRVKLLNPTIAPNGRWISTAHRVEVLLPPASDDRFSCPRILAAEIDANRPDWCQTLLTYVTITPATARLHEQFETVRGWAVELVQTYKVPAILIQHAPHLHGAHHRDHIHVLICPREMAASGAAGPLGLGSFVPELAGDQIRELFVASYDAYATAAPT